MPLTPESSPNLIQPDFTLVYDSAGNVGTITHSVVGGSSLATFSYAYDSANRLTHETNAEGSVTYTYDNKNQLTSATGARSESYAYDVNGNRNTTGYTVGTGGTLSASPNATYAYDSAGHVTAKTDTATGKITTFAYDYRDRLTGATRKTSGSVVDYQVTYTYDALNRRIGEQIDADGAGSGTPVQTWTLFDGQNPYADFTGSGTLNDRYLYGPAVDSLLARTDASGVTNWYLSDRLGSVRDIVDVSGNVVYHTGYDSFGNNVNASGSGGDRFGFTGREHDAALNLYYNRARFYDPATGRFLSKDPIGFESGDMNLFRYVNNSPINGRDPSGLDWLDSASNFFAGVGDVLTGSATDALRNYAGINGGIDYNSWEYSAGQLSGDALRIGMGVGNAGSAGAALTDIGKMLGQQMSMQGVGLVGVTGYVYVSGGVVVSTQAVAVGLITTGFAIGSLNTILLHMEEYGKRIPAPEKQVGYIRDKIYKELGKDSAREFYDLKDRALGDCTIIEVIEDAMQLYEDAGQLIPKWLKRINL